MGSNFCPEKFILEENMKPTTTLNPAYEAWQKQDQLLPQRWHIATILSKSISTQVVELAASPDVWITLECKLHHIAELE